MSKLPALRPREVVRALEKAGFQPVRQKGSHLQMKKGNLLVTVPVHPGNIHPTTLHSILRQAKLSIDEFTDLLKA